MHQANYGYRYTVIVMKQKKISIQKIQEIIKKITEFVLKLIFLEFALCNDTKSILYTVK